VRAITGTYNGVTNPTFAYDANGNLTSGGGRTLSYTSFNMTATVTQGANFLHYQTVEDYCVFFNALTLLSEFENENASRYAAPDAPHIPFDPVAVNACDPVQARIRGSIGQAGSEGATAGVWMMLIPVIGFLESPKTWTTRGAIACTVLTMSHAGITAPTNDFIAHCRQRADNRPVGAEPTAASNSNHNARNITMTATIMPRPALSIQVNR